MFSAQLFYIIALTEDKEKKQPQDFVDNNAVVVIADKTHRLKAMDT